KEPIFTIIIVLNSTLQMKAHDKKHFNRSGYIILSRVLLYMVTTLFCALSPFSAFSQGKEANIWYFGAHAGIDFNTGSPPSALINGQTNLFTGPSAGTATISDENGRLLFYSDGIRIWNLNHVIMLNGDNIGNISTQGAMIVKDPGNPNYYY